MAEKRKRETEEERKERERREKELLEQQMETEVVEQRKKELEEVDRLRREEERLEEERKKKVKKEFEFPPEPFVFEEEKEVTESFEKRTELMRLKRPQERELSKLIKDLEDTKKRRTDIKDRVVNLQGVTDDQRKIIQRILTRFRTETRNLKDQTNKKDLDHAEALRKKDGELADIQNRLADVKETLQRTETREKDAIEKIEVMRTKQEELENEP